MNSPDRHSGALQMLVAARKIADFAKNLGIDNFKPRPRSVVNHLGAVMADAILQAGVRYKTVVKPRVERIVVLYPSAATMDGNVVVVETNSVSEFLMWRHHVKIARFINLVTALHSNDIENTANLKAWLQQPNSRRRLLEITGIGPKTVDYMCCLVGMDCIAVDRHVRAFAKRAGVDTTEYEELKNVVSHAADLLGIARRDLDSWMWDFMSSANSRQYSLF